MAASSSWAGVQSTLVEVSIPCSSCWSNQHWSRSPFLVSPVGPINAGRGLLSLFPLLVHATQVEVSFPCSFCWQCKLRRSRILVTASSPWSGVQSTLVEVSFPCSSCWSNQRWSRSPFLLPPGQGSNQRWSRSPFLLPPGQGSNQR